MIEMVLLKILLLLYIITFGIMLGFLVGVILNSYHGYRRILPLITAFLVASSWIISVPAIVIYMRAPRN